MSEKLSINLDDLTLGEMDEFEELSGIKLSDIDGGSIPAKALIALVFISKKRTDPKYTIKKARAVKVTDLQLGADPTPAKPGETT